MNKIIGKALPGMPWQERPQDCDRPIWRYSENPIIGRHDIPIANSIFNSAVVPFEDGYAGVFRCDSLSVSMDIFAGFSKDAIHWEINHEPITFTGDDAEVTKREYRYDPRVTWIEYAIWMASTILPGATAITAPPSVSHTLMILRHSISWRMLSCPITGTGCSSPEKSAEST